jgi:hypothetical protein
MWVSGPPVGLKALRISLTPTSPVIPESTLTASSTTSVERTDASGRGRSFGFVP